jgi:hypothetical protein
MKTTDRERWLTQLVGAACCVVGADRGVRSITIVTNRRPTFDQLVELREHAASCAAHVSAAERGSIVVRRSAMDDRESRDLPR